MKNFTYLRYKTLGSTNQKLYQLAKNNFPEFTVVSTEHQTSGKGQRGSTWESSANENLTFSFLLRFDDFPSHEAHLISIWVSIYLQKFLSDCHIESKIKWPNDIIIHQKKAGGILIENQIQGQKIQFAVVGIGLNVYQKNFQGLKKATSIQNEFPEFSKGLKNFEMNLINFLFENHKKLKPENKNNLYQSYNQQLLGFQKINTFEQNGVCFSGIIYGIDEHGRLLVKREKSEVIEIFDIKEISLIY